MRPWKYKNNVDFIIISQCIKTFFLRPLCSDWRSNELWTPTAPPESLSRFCSCRWSARRKRCPWLLAGNFCSWHGSSRLTTLPPQWSRRFRLRFRRRFQWSFWMWWVLPGKVAALVSGEESSVFDSCEVGLVSLVGSDLRLRVVAGRWEAKVIHLNSYKLAISLI